jgi:Asp-tRNA(Asn)/Glu-tRNA(Gln) amidotransferase A subunit family amidase
MTVSAAELAAQCISDYSIWEPQIHAFVWVDVDHFQTLAARADAIEIPARGSLHGIPVGVKDVFDTSGIPTRYGSPIFNERVPAQSAAAVTRLESAGAIVFGKTVTAELAYFEPGPTTNPWNLRRTPGGSSMGSAAAVAAGVVPLATGTQTNGSVIRPAAFCGVVGFKPTPGRLPTDGMLRFSPSLDQVGVFARTVKESARAAAVIAGEAPSAWAPELDTGTPPRLAVFRTPDWTLAQPSARARFDSDLAAMEAAGASLTEVDLPNGLLAANTIHRTIMAAEAHRYVGPLVMNHRNRCSQQILGLLNAGAVVSETEYQAALEAQVSLKRQYTEWIGNEFQAIVTLPVLGEAPSLATTGDPRCCTRWTLLGVPAITLPTGLGPNGLPLGIQLVGKLGNDQELLRVADWFESITPPIGAPRSQAERSELA